MLVKFKTTKGTPIKIDSSKIHAEGNDIYIGTKIQWAVDDATLAYLENAWAHEGMRRVLVIIGDEFDSALKGITAWFDPMTERIIWDNGEFIKSIDVDSYRFIHYEMEEQNG